ncbi:MAG: ATP-binding protein [Pseudonocardiaceae bacterium]
MGWQYVGRAEQLERVRAAFEGGASSPLAIIGQRGVGRSTLALRALEYVDIRRDLVIRVDPHPSRAPLAALSHVLPAGFDVARGWLPTVRTAADHVFRLAGQRRAVLMVDDAHLLDHITMLVLGELAPPRTPRSWRHATSVATVRRR